MSLPSDAKERKDIPITTGVLDYFPLAIAAVARVSKAGNDQHNPGQPLHWARDKSTDHADCIGRHLLQRGTVDTDGMSHTAKMTWRALALLQLEEEAKAKVILTEALIQGPKGSRVVRDLKPGDVVTVDKDEKIVETRAQRG